MNNEERALGSILDNPRVGASADRKGVVMARSLKSSLPVVLVCAAGITLGLTSSGCKKSSSGGVYPPPGGVVTPPPPPTQAPANLGGVTPQAGPIGSGEVFPVAFDQVSGSKVLTWEIIDLGTTTVVASGTVSSADDPILNESFVVNLTAPIVPFGGGVKTWNLQAKLTNTTTQLNTSTRDFTIPVLEGSPTITGVDTHGLSLQVGKKNQHIHVMGVFTGFDPLTLQFSVDGQPAKLIQSFGNPAAALGGFEISLSEQASVGSKQLAVQFPGYASPSTFPLDFLSKTAITLVNSKETAGFNGRIQQQTHSAAGGVSAITELLPSNGHKVFAISPGIESSDYWTMIRDTATGAVNAVYVTGAGTASVVQYTAPTPFLAVINSLIESSVSTLDGNRASFVYRDAGFANWHVAFYDYDPSVPEVKDRIVLTLDKVGMLSTSDQITSAQSVFLELDFHGDGKAQSYQIMTQASSVTDAGVGIIVPMEQNSTMDYIIIPLPFKAQGATLWTHPEDGCVSVHFWGARGGTVYDYKVMLPHDGPTPLGAERALSSTLGTKPVGVAYAYDAVNKHEYAAVASDGDFTYSLTNMTTGILSATNNVTSTYRIRHFTAIPGQAWFAVAATIGGNSEVHVVNGWDSFATPDTTPMPGFTSHGLEATDDKLVWELTGAIDQVYTEDLVSGATSLDTQGVTGGDHRYGLPRTLVR